MARRAAVIFDGVDRVSPVLSKIKANLGALGALAAAAGAFQIGRTIVSGLAEAAKAAGEAQKAEAVLANAIRLTGQSANDVLPALRAHASALQDQTGIDADLILQNQALLVSLGRLEGEGLQRATRAAVDLSAKTGSLEGAFDLVAKAAAGNTAQLGRYGIKVDQSASQSERFAQALEGIEAAFGGRAAAELDTFTGRLAEFDTRLEDLSETIGGPLAEVGEAFLRDFLSPLVKDLTGAVAGTDAWRDTILDLGIALARISAPLEFFVRNFEVLFAASRAATSGGAVGAVVGVLGVLNAGLDTTTPKVDALIESLEKLKASGPRQAADIPRVAAAEPPIDPDAVLESIGAQQELAQSIKRASDEIDPLRDKSTEFLTVFGEQSIAAADALRFGFSNSFEFLGRQLAAGGLKLQSFRKELTGIVGDQMIAGANALGAALVDAAFGAKVAWGAFFKQFLKDLATAIVQALILRAILSALGFGGFGGQSGGRGTSLSRPVGFAGFGIPGNPNRGDSVPALLRPGELVLTEAMQRSMAASSGPLTVFVELGPNLRALTDRISVEVERGTARLTASAVAAPAYRR